MATRSRTAHGVVELRIGRSRPSPRRSRATALGLAGLLVTLALSACSSATATPTQTPIPAPLPSASPTGVIIVPGSAGPTATEMSSESPTPTSTLPQQTPAATGAPGQTAAPTIDVKCPSPAVVGAALDLLANQAPTGPTIDSTQVGTESMTTCNYSGMFRTMVSFAVFGSPADMASAEAGAAAMQGSTAVPGLGDQAYYVPDAGLDVFVYPLSLLQISCSQGPTAEQYEALARAILGG